jgi:hypothetical protein
MSDLTHTYCIRQYGRCDAHTVKYYNPGSHPGQKNPVSGKMYNFGTHGKFEWLSAYMYTVHTRGIL